MFVHIALQSITAELDFAKFVWNWLGNFMECLGTGAIGGQRIQQCSQMGRWRNLGCLLFCWPRVRNNAAYLEGPP